MTAEVQHETRKPVRVDFYIHGNAHSCPALLKAGNSAFGVFTRCGIESARTDRPGFVSKKIAQRSTADWLLHAKRLMAAGLWEATADGWDMVPVPVPFEPIFKFTPVYRREPIPAPLRQRVMERDGYACTQCGITNDLTLDHIHPWSKGGPDTYGNLRVLCRSCNSRKGAKV